MLLGVDEVGRGPWAGPLVVGAVILGPRFASFTQPQPIKSTEISHNQGQNQSSSANAAENPLYTLWQTLTDSKQLTPKRRQQLNAQILDSAAATGLGWVSAAELDQYGLSLSLKIATHRAVKQILAQNVAFDEIIIDGTINFLRDTPLAGKVSTLKKADLLIKEVSAASIIAKVARDDYMAKLATTYPEYHFEKHVGYGTAQHRQAILEYGICPEHRRSFHPIAQILSQSREPIVQVINQSQEPIATKPSSRSDTTTARGQRAEAIVAKHLQTQGHAIIAQDFKTKTYEIDLISAKDQQIFFTEVKYRQNSTHGDALAQITPAKLRQMQYAAQAFLTAHPEYQTYQPLLTAGAVSGPDFQFENWLILD